ncbi:glycosyltransferase [Paenibacillus sp. CAU 1523]|uniref:Glycosyltransferase n=2 Tax=Paenibacillus arenosi TaxID=2774142 RepID=A0ABR9AZP1_9BACL|nr:glycosyltransferase [Paenibacillus arenosi]
MVVMKILFLERGKLWSYGLPDGLRDLGHEVRTSGPITRHSLSTLFTFYKPDLLINVGWGLDHTPKNELMMRELATSFKIPLIYWSTEDPNFTKVFTLPLLSRLKPDFVFTISPQTVDVFRKKGYAAAHMDFGFHPNVHRKLQPIRKYKADFAVVANAYPDVLQKYPKLYRRTSLNTLIKPLLKSGAKIDFYGRNWARMKPYLGKAIPKRFLKGPIPYKDTNKVYSSAKIILGLQNYTDMVTQRTYEAIGSGGFLLTNSTPATRQLLKSGRDAALSSSPAETLKLARYYLANAQARERVRRNGRQTISKHNYTNRARYMLSILKKHGLI